jgi:hypothetical protein
MSGRLVRAVGDHRHMPADLVRDGDLWPADHPVVAAHPDWFQPLEGADTSPAKAKVEVEAAAEPVIEQATAEPGERRATRRRTP